MRTSILNGMETIHFTRKNERYIDFSTQFQICELGIEEKHFHRKSNEFKVFVKKNSWRGEERKCYTEVFSKDIWENLTNEKKQQHKLYLCDECNHYFKATQDMFPVAGCKNKNKSVAKNIKTPTPEPRNNHVEIPLVKKNPEYMIAAAESILKDVSNVWKTHYETHFTALIPKIPDINLTPRKTKVEKQRKLRKIHRRVKQNIENAWTDNNRDVETLYGTRQSGSRHDTQRSCMFFERKHKAVNRACKGK